MTRDTRLVCLGLLLLGAAACGTEANAGAEYTTVDSAGVAIVTSVSGPWTDDTMWRVAPEPALDIGVLDGPEVYQLFRVRDARRLDDGRVVVANVGTSEIRFFGADGVHLMSQGREGEGPGEYQQLGWVRPFRGDSLLVYDINGGRMSVLGGDGAFVRSFTIRPLGEVGFVIGVDVFADGTVLAKSPLMFAGGFEPGLQRRDEVFHTASATGDVVDSIGPFPGPEQYLEMGGSGTSRFIAITSLPFGLSPSVAATGDRFCFGSSEAYEIRCYRKDGSLERIIRRPQAPRSVTSADVDAYRREQLADVEDANDRADFERRMAEMPIPETMPAYGSIRFDDAGNLWVQAFTVGDAETEPWTVFDPEGRMLGDVALPADLRVTQIGDDFVLGVWEDEYEVQHVRSYPLEKGH